MKSVILSINSPFKILDKCDNPVGSCIKNQIEDFYQEDLKRIQQGKIFSLIISLIIKKAKDQSI